jgi:hypothetical protein
VLLGRDALIASFIEFFGIIWFIIIALLEFRLP